MVPRTNTRGGKSLGDHLKKKIKSSAPTPLDGLIVFIKINGKERKLTVYPYGLKKTKIKSKKMFEISDINKSIRYAIDSFPDKVNIFSGNTQIFQEITITIYIPTNFK